MVRKGLTNHWKNPMHFAGFSIFELKMLICHEHNRRETFYADFVTILLLCNMLKLVMTGRISPLRFNLTATAEEQPFQQLISTLGP